MRLVTWNMQGAGHSDEVKWQTGVLNMIATMELDVICLQECGTIPASATWLDGMDVKGPDGYIYSAQLYQLGTDRAARYVLIFDWDQAGNRCNVAVVTRTKPTDCRVVWAASGAQWRPALGVPVDGGWVYSLHAISPGGADVKGILAAVAARSPAPLPWVVAGDFNRGPGTVEVPAGSTVCAPHGSTYPTKSPDKTYDYCVRSPDPSVAGGVVTAIVMSDHYPVGYDGL
jgi:cytolethal distending toxin subunit B